MNRIAGKVIVILAAVVLISQSAVSESDTSEKKSNNENFSMLSGIHTLTIHVKDTTTHEAVFRFLTDKLMLPVHYYPVTYQGRKYAGVYAGNMIIEPCGPYRNMNYTTSDFEALFFGLNFESNDYSNSTAFLSARQVDYKVLEEGKYLEITDTLIRKNTYLSLIKIEDKEKRDSVRMTNGFDGPGIEYVKKITFGCESKDRFDQWKKLFTQEQLIMENNFALNDSLGFQLDKSNINGVRSILFKIRSMEKAKQYFSENGLFGYMYKNELVLDRSKTFGLLISVTDEK